MKLGSEEVNKMLAVCTDLKLDGGSQAEDGQEAQSTSATFYAKVTECRVLNPENKYQDDYKAVYEISLKFSRGIGTDKIQPGQSVAVFP